MRAGDSDGAVVLWHVGAQEDGSLRLLRRLTPGGVAASGISTLVILPDEEENEEALILATNEGGELLKWTVACAVEGLNLQRTWAPQHRGSLSSQNTAMLFI